jgi:hypothetical protein
MAHVERSCNIRGRDRNDEFALRLDFAIFGELGLEVASAFPPLVPVGFNLLWLVGIDSSRLLDFLLFRGLGLGSRRSLFLSLLVLEFGELLRLFTFFLDCSREIMLETGHSKGTEFKWMVGFKSNDR